MSTACHADSTVVLIHYKHSQVSRCCHSVLGYVGSAQFDEHAQLTVIFTFGCCILLRIYPTGSL
jgi:hypothetical protein